MVVENEKKRLKAIKEKYVFFPAKCNCCKKEYKREKMWKVYRYGVNETYHEYFYCKNCMNSKEEVLEEIDADESPFGIAGVDDFVHYTKKDYTRLKRSTITPFRGYH